MKVQITKGDINYMVNEVIKSVCGKMLNEDAPFTLNTDKPHRYSGQKPKYIYVKDTDPEIKYYYKMLNDGWEAARENHYGDSYYIFDLSLSDDWQDKVQFKGMTGVFIGEINFSGCFINSEGDFDCDYDSDDIYFQTDEEDGEDNAEYKVIFGNDKIKSFSSMRSDNIDKTDVYNKYHEEQRMAQEKARQEEGERWKQEVLKEPEQYKAKADELYKSRDWDQVQYAEEIYTALGMEEEAKEASDKVRDLLSWEKMHDY